jgi:hypothetical protein
MLQGFTSRSDDLVRAANQIDPKDFHLIPGSLVTASA